MISPDKRIIDMTLGELTAFLDERYGMFTQKMLPQSNSKEVEFLNVVQCASLTGYTPDYIRQLVFKRAIPFYKVRRLLRFMRSEIVNWMCCKKHLPIEQLADEHVNQVKSFNRIKSL